MPTTTKLLLLGNALCLALFLGLAFILPMHGQTQAQQRFTQLDKAGAVNHASIAKMKLTKAGDQNDQGNGAGPWIAAPAITATRSAANVGIALTLFNVSLFTASSWKSQKKR